MTRDNLMAGTAPVFRVEDEAKPELSNDLTRLDIEEDTNGLRHMSARFTSTGPHGSDQAEQQERYLDGQIFDFGKKIKVSIGPPEDDRTLFEGSLSALEVDFSEGDSGEVVIACEDKLMDLRMTRRMKTYRDVSDADLARQIAQQHGLSPEVQADGPTYKFVQQFNTTDLAFLRDRARLLQAEVWVRGTTLYFKTRPNRSAGAEIQLVRDNHLINIQVRADLADQRTKVKVSGYDASQRDKIDEEAGSDAIQSEAPSGRNGPGVLQQAFGERVSYRVRDVPLVSGEARAWARAEMLRRARTFVIATGTTDGTPDMVVGSVLNLQNVGRPFEGGSYYVTHVWHSYDNTNGHRTRFEAARATLNEGQ
jgi:Bacteriophage probable baseplate hub protein